MINFNEENELTIQDNNTTENETTDAFEEIETGLTETDENAEPVQSGNPKPATSYSPEPAEAKQADASSPKGLVAIVAIMGVIIIGLIVFLVMPFALKRASKITVRDNKSLELLDSWGIKAELVKDPIFNMEIPKAEKTNSVCVQLRDFKGVDEVFLQRLAEKIKEHFEISSLKTA